MSKKIPKILAIRCLTVALLVATGCSNDSNEASRNVLNRGINGDPETLHPHRQRSNQASQVIRDIYEGLVVQDASGEILGAIAEDFTISKSGLLYEFKIRADARWSDGSPILGSQVVRSFRCLANPKSGSTNSDIISSVVNGQQIIGGERPVESLGIIAPSEDTVQFVLTQPNFTFPMLLALPGASIVYTESELTEACAQVSNLELRKYSGAYKVSRRIVGSKIELERNDNYWESERTRIKSVVYHVVDPVAEVLRFRANELDITANVPSAFFQKAKLEFTDELRVSPFLGVYYIGFNLTNPQFGSDPNFRAALFHGIDRQAIAWRVLGRGERPANTWVHPDVKGYADVGQNMDYLLDRANSSKAMDSFRRSKAFVKKKVELDLLFNSGGGHEQIMLAVQAMWLDALKIKTNLVKEEWKVFLSNVQAGISTDLFRLSWTADYNDALAFLEIFESGHSQNLIGYSNEAFDELIRQSRLQLSNEARIRVLKQAELILLSDYALIPVYFYVSKHLVSTRVGGWRNDVLDIHRTKDLWIVESN